MSLDLDAWAEDFQHRAAPLVHQALLDVVGGHDPADVAALGLYTDADATSVVAAACTRAHLHRQQDGEEDPEYHRWATNEWDRNGVDVVEAGGRDALADVVAELRLVGEQVERGGAGDDTPHVFRFIAWAALVNAFTLLDLDGRLDAYDGAVRVFEVVDADIDHETQREWIEQLNTEVDAADFARWLARSDVV